MPSSPGSPPYARNYGAWPLNPRKNKDITRKNCLHAEAWGRGCLVGPMKTVIHCKNIMVISTHAKVTSVALYEGSVITMAA